MAMKLFKNRRIVEEAPTYTRPTARPEKTGRQGDPGPMGKRGMRGRRGDRGPQGVPGPGGGLPNAAITMKMFYRSGQYSGAASESYLAIDPSLPKIMEKSSFPSEDAVDVSAEGYLRVHIGGAYPMTTMALTPIDLRDLVPEPAKKQEMVHLLVEYFRVESDDSE